MRIYLTGDLGDKNRKPMDSESRGKGIVEDGSQFSGWLTEQIIMPLLREGTRKKEWASSSGLRVARWMTGVSLDGMSLNI